MSNSEETSLRVSLVATVFNEAATIVRFVDSVRAQTRRPDEIVIVDGGSTDGTPEAIRAAAGDDLPLRLIIAPGLNISQGRNHAIAEARGALIACSDAGCVLLNTWLEHIIAPLEADDGVDVSAGFYEMDCDSLLQQCVGLATMPGQLEPVDPDAFLPSARSVAFRKEVWQAAGGYPEWLYTAEDTLFDRKLKQMGFRFRFAGDARVAWAPRRTWRSIARQFYLYARGQGHLATGRPTLTWAAKRLVAFVVAAVAGVFWWPAWLIVPAAFVWDHLWIVHPTARRVARRLGSARAYVVTSLVLWLISFSRIAGTLRGTLQRRADPEKYVENLARYMPGEPEPAGSDLRRGAREEPLG